VTTSDCKSLIRGNKQSIWEHNEEPNDPYTKNKNKGTQIITKIQLHRYMKEDTPA
jgi:hypothetical protein